MDQPWSGRFDELKARFEDFMAKEVIPAEPKYLEQLKQVRESNNRWRQVPLIEELKAKAKAAQLWNLFLPAASGINQYQYAQLAEQMGRYIWCAEVFNCDAPDTGNMETLHLYGTPEQKEQYLKPLMEGVIRSAFVMTEPAVASSDATNLETVASRDGGHYVINGRKWYASGFGNENCKILIVMARSVPVGDTSKPKHQRHSMILVPRDTPGVVSVRPMCVFGQDDAPHGHFEVEFKNVRVPVGNILLGEGKGFAIAQGRLGPGRIHHCMRSIGMAERALELMIKRAVSREAFGQPLAKNLVVQHQVAQSRCDIDQARLLVLHAADTIDKHGTRKAFQQVAMIKAVVPRMSCTVIDRAIQVHGAEGISQDSMLSVMYAGQRGLRFADGPDEVHLTTTGKIEIARQVKVLTARGELHSKL